MSMDIHASKGTKVRYKGCDNDQASSQFGSHDDPRGILIDGEVYIVVKTDVRDWSSNVHLKGFEDKGFNTVCFEEELQEEKK